MALPSSREQFKYYCLRKLGHPVIEINAADEQLEDRIDEALNLWYYYHCEGTSKTYYKYQVTPTDISNKYIQLPPNIIGAVDLFPIGQSLNTNNIFNIRYQIALNDLYTLTSVSMVPYVMALTHIQFLEQILVGQQPLRYNRYSNILYIDMDWSIVNPGDFIVVVAYAIMDPDIYTAAWSDRWLLRYGACLFKLQWASNMKKYGNMQLPGGLFFNAQQMWNEAEQERKDLEYELINSWGLLESDLLGMGNLRNTLCMNTMNIPTNRISKMIKWREHPEWLAEQYMDLSTISEMQHLRGMV
jgi:hypothetical protein